MKTTTITLLLSAVLPLTTQDIIGVPSIRCTPDGVFAYMNTTGPFTGHVYLKGHFGKKGCHRHFGTQPMEITSPLYTARTEFRYNACPMRRKRQLNPRGLIMSGVMVVAHHSTLLTYRDRAYSIECYYREDNNIVQTEMRVNSRPPFRLASDPIPLPSCQYRVEMASNSSQTSPSSSPAVVTIGDSVVHLWTCGDAVHNEIYCMLVHSCVADDGGSEKVTVIDSNGCSTDKELLSSVSYPSPMRAFAKSRVFKFADRSDINFACQIRLSMRQDAVNGTCPRPACSARGQRSLNIGRPPRSVVFDVVASPMTVLETPPYDYYEVQKGLTKRRKWTARFKRRFAEQFINQSSRRTTCELPRAAAAFSDKLTDAFVSAGTEITVVRDHA